MCIITFFAFILVRIYLQSSRYSCPFDKYMNIWLECVRLPHLMRPTFCHHAKSFSFSLFLSLINDFIIKYLSRNFMNLFYFSCRYCRCWLFSVHPLRRFCHFSAALMTFLHFSPLLWFIIKSVCIDGKCCQILIGISIQNKQQTSHSYFVYYYFHFVRIKRRKFSIYLFGAVVRSWRWV